MIYAKYINPHKIIVHEGLEIVYNGRHIGKADMSEYLVKNGYKRYIHSKPKPPFGMSVVGYHYLQSDTLIKKCYEYR